MFGKEWIDFRHAGKWVMLFCLLYVSTIVYYASHNSWFLGQDFDHLVLLQSLSFWDYLFAPIDIHNPLPLHRLFCWLVYKPLGMNFLAASAMLGVFHLFGVYFFYRVLAHISPGVSAAFLAVILCINLYVLDLLFWWSAGLHRFPCLALIFAVCHMALDPVWLKNPIRLVVFVALAQLIGFGFFEKSVFLPLYLAACFSAVYCVQGIMPSRLQLGILVVTLIISLGYLMLLPHGHQEYPSLEQSLSAGIKYLHYYLISFLPWRLAPLPSFSLVLFFYGFVVVACALLNRRVIIAVGFIAVALGGSVAPLVHSSRVLLFGEDVVVSLRYFHDNLFLLFIFFHLILGVWFGRLRAIQAPFLSIKLVLVLVLVLAGYGAISFLSARQEMIDLYSKDGHSGGERAARFVANLESAIRQESIVTSPLYVQDRMAPQSLYVAVFGVPELPLSSILKWYDNRIIFVEGNGGYAINDDGTLKKLTD